MITISERREQESAKNFVLRVLIDNIVNTRLEPGEKLNEPELCEQLGVSRTPVREAVLRLAREGLLVVMPRRGTVISNISMEDIRQLYEARVMLEPQILRIAAKRADKNTLTRWKAFFEGQAAQADAEGASLPFPDEDAAQHSHDADAAFHLFLAQSIGNRYIVQQMEELMAQSQRIRNLSNARRKSRYLASIQEHIRIVDALLEEDGERAAREVLEHLHNSEDGYHRMMLEDAPDIFQMY